LAFAVTWLTLLSIAYMHHRSSDDRTDGVLIVAVAAVVIAGGFNIVQHLHADMQRYEVKDDVPTIEIADWWKSGWLDLPVQRVDFTGETEEPFTLQWAGSLDRLKATLENGSWQEPPIWTTESSLRWFAASKPMLLPVASHLERGMMPSLTLVRANETSESSSRYVLRVWRADRRLDDNLHTELWLGSVVEEEFSSHLFMVIYPVAKNSFDGPRNVLRQALAASRLANRGGAFSDAAWDGGVLLSHDATLVIE
jgi:undecaprenyl-diphosphatase